MTPAYMRRRRAAALLVAALAVMAFGVYKVVTWVPGDVRDAAIAAVQATNRSLNSDDEWYVACDNARRPVYVCTVTWKQVDREYADGPADYCYEDRVTVRGEEAGEALPVVGDDGLC